MLQAWPVQVTSQHGMFVKRLIVAYRRVTRLPVCQVAIPDVEEYSVEADAWVQRAPLATPVSHFAAAYLDSQVIAFGGQDACTTVALCANQ